MVIDTCVACGEQGFKTAPTIEGYIEGNSYIVKVCNYCGTHMASPHQSDSQVYEWIYKNRRVAPGYARYAQFADEVLSVQNPLLFLAQKEEMYYGVANEIQRIASRNGKILDVGCGLGYFTYALNKAGYSATGIDVSKEAISNAKEKYGNMFVCEDFFTYSPDEKYDVICMLELIEHVDDPRAYIERACALLKPNGWIIVTTPNRSWFPKEDIWNTDLPPVHITWFSEKGMIKLLSSHGLIPQLFDYWKYNLSRGTLCAPLHTPEIRSSVFNREGRLLVTPYHKSKMRIFTEKLYVYHFLKRSLELVQKLHDYLNAIFCPSRVALHRSGTICISGKLSN